MQINISPTIGLYMVFGLVDKERLLKCALQIFDEHKLDQYVLKTIAEEILSSSIHVSNIAAQCTKCLSHLYKLIKSVEVHGILIYKS